jgi:acetyl-CoA/propionyl-CoA carboxylase biotin carboxyl carrier protein
MRRAKRDSRDMKDALGPSEAARQLGVSTRTVQRWLREGRLPAVKVGSRLKVKPGALGPIAAAAPLAPVAAGAPARPIRRLLVANRGELVVRIARTCRALGIRSVALVAEDEAEAWWTSAADEVVPLAGSYLDQDAVLAAARAARADAIHPGYGFLAENPAFAEAVLASGVTWVGPPPAAMRALGDKAAARQLAAELGIPVLEGYQGQAQTDGVLAREARRIGLPLIIKPSAGGGGKGMHVVRRDDELPEALARARREAAQAFGDDRLVLERHLEQPRHVEIQVLCDGHGGAVHLGERECSLQRRHQKVIEEAPSPAVNAQLRRELGAAALKLARAAGYQGAGTAEFLLAADGRYYFLELNARLQVEHPVTELVTGRDLVADQLRVAAGGPLGFSQRDVTMKGHAIEARLYAEDPDSDFLPATGQVVDVRWPSGEGIRIDAGIGSGDVVGTRYDPLLCKIVTHGRNRTEAIRRLDDALAAAAVLGVTTNRGFLRWLLQLSEVSAGATHTQLIDSHWRAGDEDLSAAEWQAAAVTLSLADGMRSGTVTTGFRLNQRPRLPVQIGGETRSVEVPDLPAEPAPWLALGPREVILDLDGRSIRAGLAAPPTVEAAMEHAAHAGDTAQRVAAPMPGNVLEVRVAEGQDVQAGQVLLVLEAMKMENAVTAPAVGRVARVLVKPGQQVQRAEPLIELA